VAFDFRVKAKASDKPLWDRLFFAGSMLASLSQGWMLGRYISGFGEGWNYPVFAAAIAVALPAAYALLGAAWLIMKTEGELQAKAIGWAKLAWWPVVVGMVLISLATPWVSATVRERWFTLPALIALMVIPLATGISLLTARLLLNKAIVRTTLTYSLRRCSVRAGKLMRMTTPSFDGFTPRSLSRMARSMAGSVVRSCGLTTS
jgi:cytochrome d ubiquinol oxidase subunit II